MEKESKIANFIKYNNAVPIILGLLFFSTSATLAASPAVRDTVYKAETSVVSPDNSFLLSTDLEDYSFAVRITKITEDSEYYYLAYDIDTIATVEGVWRDLIEERLLRVSKVQLGSGDLQAFAESELAQVIWHERNNLVQIQESEKKLGLSQKVVATAYEGVIGRFFEPTEEIVPLYMAEIAKNDPLRVKNPKPLVTWDQNAAQEAMEGQEEDDDRDDGPKDYCPDMAGVQELPSLCARIDEPPTEEPPVEEPPAEGEEPPVETPSEPEPQPEPEPEPEEESEEEEGNEESPAEPVTP